MKVTLALVLALSAWPWYGAIGQEPPPFPDQLIVVVEGLHVGQRIRLNTASSGRLHGIFLEVETSAIRITRGSSGKSVELVDIDRLWVRGRATRTGAVVGALAGTVVGAAFGLFIGEVICNGPDCSADTAGAMVILGLFGGGVGALSGALIGLAIPKWHLRFP